MFFEYHGWMVAFDINEHHRTFLATLYRDLADNNPIIIEAETVDDLEQGVFYSIGKNQQFYRNASPFADENLSTLNPRDFFKHESFKDIDDLVLWEACRSVMKSFLKAVDIERAFDHQRQFELAIRHGSTAIELRDQWESQKKKKDAGKGGKKKAENEFLKAVEDVNPLFDHFIRAKDGEEELSILNAKGKPIPKNKWVRETFVNYCFSARAGYGKPMLRKIYDHLLPSTE